MVLGAFYSHQKGFQSTGDDVMSETIEQARKVVGDGPTYVSFDVDGMDPVYAPGTGTPEVGGFTSYEAQQMLRGLRGINIVGGDLVEVSPPFDTAGITALNGIQMMAWGLGPTKTSTRYY